ncbi:MAG: indole-3-glycerol phosphate synthase TrpC [Candidatus Dadabacteria bacterium]
MILDEILQNKRIEVERAKRSHSLNLLSSQIENVRPPMDFHGAIRSDGEVKIIAEIKCASPSKGILSEKFNPSQIAKGYVRGGASAISVLTDKRFFKGHLTHLRDVRYEVSVPLLRKDFIIDPYQIYEARLYGADAILLIAGVLKTKVLTELLSLSAIVEVHSEDELETALLAESRIIGINNRDLKTFNVSLDVSTRLIKLIPKEKVVVSESGISSSEDIRRLRDEGIYTFLIGETLMRASNPGEELKNLIADCIR